jgi:hypothetical protein
MRDKAGYTQQAPIFNSRDIINPGRYCLYYSEVSGKKKLTLDRPVEPKQTGGGGL